MIQIQIFQNLFKYSLIFYFIFLGYENILKYIQDHNNWNQLEDELRHKGVKALTFYDVVLDYILMDAFEDLESPPSSVTGVVQNRW